MAGRRGPGGARRTSRYTRGSCRPRPAWRAARRNRVGSRRCRRARVVPRHRPARAAATDLTFTSHISLGQVPPLIQDANPRVLATEADEQRLAGWQRRGSSPRSAHRARRRTRWLDRAALRECRRLASFVHRWVVRGGCAVSRCGMVAGPCVAHCLRRLHQPLTRRRTWTPRGRVCSALAGSTGDDMGALYVRHRSAGTRESALTPSPRQPICHVRSRCGRQHRTGFPPSAVA